MDVCKKYPAQFVGLGVTLIFLALGIFLPGVLGPLDLKLYEAGMRLREGPGAPGDIVVALLDGGLAGEPGGAPWTRSRIAEAVREIGAGSPKVIGLDVALGAPEGNPALREIDGLIGLLAESAATSAGGKAPALGKALAEARAKLDGDARLAEAIKAAGMVVLPVFVKPSGDRGAESGAPDDVLASLMIRSKEGGASAGIPRASVASLPLPAFLQAASGIGHIASGADDAPRRDQLLYRCGPFHLLPSYALRIAALRLNIPEDDIRIEGGSAIRLGSLEIPLDAGGGVLVSGKGRSGAYSECACSDILAGKVPASAFNDKIVLVSAPDVMGFGSSSTMGVFAADSLWSILSGKTAREPRWGIATEVAMMLFVGAVLALVLPRLGGAAAGGALAGLFALIAVGSTGMLAGGGLWIRAAHPLLQLIVGGAGVAAVRFWRAVRRSAGPVGDSPEVQRAIGLAFLESGMLEQAFERLRVAPVDEEMKGVLYRLALAYEKKRQFENAAEVLEFIEKHDDGFRDVRKRKLKMLQTADTVVMGPEAESEGGGAQPPEAPAQSAPQEGEPRPTLGRYEIIRQLGKGAMGTVYLGQDPRINRITAIKTFRFGSDFEPEEAEKMKKKFFVEAESAGTLSHPNIVTIYDAGEDKGLAFIAMEYLEGEDLQRYTVKGRLLPMRKVIEYVADIADALDYAHQKGIVHRDVKPANIMLLKTGGVKITDFGIARITATSQTQTGVLKGTPYYMSPEQISGSKVDGRSDIFSLGVMLYQLLTANTPFTGDSLASLMSRIIKAPHPDPRRFNPKIVKPLVEVLNKALEKDREKRYQRASEMAAHLRKIGKRMDEIMAEQRSRHAAG